MEDTSYPVLALSLELLQLKFLEETQNLSHKAFTACCPIFILLAGQLTETMIILCMQVCGLLFQE